jgi:hypothetical protein
VGGAGGDRIYGGKGNDFLIGGVSGSFALGNVAPELVRRGRAADEGRLLRQRPVQRGRRNGVGIFRPNHLARAGAMRRLRGATHLLLERALNPTRVQMLGLAALSIASLTALIGLLAVLEASRTSLIGRGAYNVEVGDAPAPSVVTEPDVVGQNENDPTKTRSEGEGESSAPVFPLIGEPVNFGNPLPAGPNSQPFPDPQPAPSPSPSPAPSPDPSPTPSPPPDPSPTPEPSEEPEPSPEPSEEPEPSPEPSEEPRPSPSPPPGCVPPPHC